ncbi:UDP-glucose 4-epimerase GalE [Porphyromonas cangingivalis]|uniref:UDP-glucose 4-epimerase n=1 Tax=Porphyromonas cangingivalis TaxID=36874 RepID=A0A1T4MU67_PORCN|nr:UDP-glucose 4-epimerase GalE [Porphyromonas cangingivalis]SJZ70315.1 UDP-glucose 4-epimerase [Porphyromonas cangingivalis]VEJ01757.1 UDP-glucose 4-epimerase [Porphyromonas cangingivalis]
MKPQILVTGGTGYIGSHTTVELQLAGYEVISVDNLSNSNKGVLSGIEKITGSTPIFYELDCNDEDALRRVFDTHPNIKGVIHFAASKAVGESVEKPLLYYRNNIVPLLNLLELVEEYDNVGGLVFSSSCTVYGQPDRLPVTEQAPILPAASPYGNTKQINEEMIRDAVAAGASFKAVLLRYFNPIGAHPSAHIGELPLGVPQNLVPYLTRTAAGIYPELKVFGNDYDTPDGSCIRDFIHVVDLAKAHVKAIEHILTPSSKDLEIYNIGTGRGVSVLELIRTFEAVTGVPVPHSIAPRREGDIVAVWADPTHANEHLGWHAESTLEETLLSAWAWQKRLK